MSVDTGISCRATKGFAGDHVVVFSRLRIAVVLAHPKVDHEHPIAGLLVSHDKVIGLDVAMNDVPCMDGLKLADLQRCSQTRVSPTRNTKEYRAPYHLVCQHQNGLQAELPSTVIE
jgi:hypothetical protein